MRSPMVRHRWRKVAVDPVKWMPARSGASSSSSLISRPSPASIVMTPGGSPASASSSMVRLAASCCVGEGFQMTVLPISAGAVGRFAAMAVKLKGVIA